MSLENLSKLRMWNSSKKSKSLFHYLTTMGRIIETENTISFNKERWTRYLFRQFIAGLQKIHEAGIAHLDIKVDNVLVDIVNVDGMWQPRIKIADFGFSKLLTNEEFTETMLGSPLNMAPEVLGGNQYNSKADIWSIGVVFYEMLFGQ